MFSRPCRQRDHPIGLRYPRARGEGGFVDSAGPLISSFLILAIVLAVVVPRLHKLRGKKIAWKTPKKASAPVALASPVAPEPLGAVLLRIGPKLEKIAERSSHPREMKDWPEFKAVVEVFAGAGVGVDTLRQYALGDNWPLACAAFDALAQHPERDGQRHAVLSTLAKLRPWTI